MEPSQDIHRLIEIMARLRDPETGCPWDVKQDFTSIAPYTIEEAYEVADAIERNDPDDLCDELGDLLLQVVFHARMAQEKGLFSFGDVVEAITRKMIRRHPHVFERTGLETPEEVKAQWHAIKAEEKRERSEKRRKRGTAEPDESGLLAGVSRSQPALMEALKLQEAAARVGFDWPDAGPVTAKVEEELAEVRQALADGDRDAARKEAGDLLFAAANLARHLKADPEDALRRTNTKFRRRFGAIETALAGKGRALESATLDEMEAIWQAAKATT